MSKATLLGIPDLIRGLEWIYLLVWIGLGILAVWFPPNWKSKLGATLLVLIAGGALPVYLSLQIKQEVAIQKPIVEKRNAQLEAAMARFEERCKTAGEKIYRTVENVEGIVLTNVRPKKSAAVYDDPMWPGAGMPRESSGEDYVQTFLEWEHHEDKRNKRGYLNHTPSPLPGYAFVDKSVEGNGYTRVKLERPESNKLVESSLVGKPARYVVGFENFIDPEDRKLWIAGTKVTITDSTTNEMLAEGIWYAVELGQGNRSGFRSPWFFAKTCPSQDDTTGSVTRFFVDRVLKPKKGD